MVHTKLSEHIYLGTKRQKHRKHIQWEYNLKSQATNTRRKLYAHFIWNKITNLDYSAPTKQNKGDLFTLRP